MINIEIPPIQSEEELKTSDAKTASRFSLQLKKTEEEKENVDRQTINVVK